MKRFVGLLCAMMLCLCISLPVFARDPIISPESTPDTSETTGDNKAPQTGDMVIYVAAGVVVLASVATVAKKRLSAE